MQDHNAGARPLLSDYTTPILDEMRRVLADRGGPDRPYGDFQDNTDPWYAMMRDMGLAPAVDDPSTYCGTAYILMKLARLACTPNHEDSWIDLANYAVLTLAIQRRKRALLALAEADPPWERCEDRQHCFIRPPHSHRSVGGQYQTQYHIKEAV